MLNQKIKELRIEFSYSQEFVAKCLGITRPAYSMYETGMRIPDYKSIIILADLYNVSTDYIFERTTCKKPYNF